MYYKIHKCNQNVKANMYVYVYIPSAVRKRYTLQVKIRALLICASYMNVTTYIAGLEGLLAGMQPLSNKTVST